MHFPVIKLNKLAIHNAKISHKMDRRKKRTSSEQYQMYIELMESDPIFASGRVPRDYDLNYLTKKWKELSDRLNKCGSGPTLTAEEWRKVSLSTNCASATGGSGLCIA